MNLNDCLKQLSTGELSNISWGNDGNGSIRIEKIPTVVGYINEALLRLFSTLALRKEVAFIELTENITKYHLNKKHSYFGGDKKYDLYIRDTPQHIFENDVIKITDVCDSMGNPKALNDHGDPWSLYTPVADTLMVPNPVQGIILAVQYQAKHPILEYEKDIETDIEIPVVLEAALKSYVAFLVYNNMNTQEAIMNAQKYKERYEEIVKNAIEQDLVNTSYAQTNLKFKRGGWI